MTIDTRSTDKRRIQDDDGDQLDIAATGNIIADTWQEKELAAGELTLASFHVHELAASSTCTLGFSTCTICDLHVIATVNASGESHAEFRENASYAGGSEIVPLNMNRQEIRKCVGTIFVSNPTVGEDGLLLLTLQSGTAGYKSQLAGSADMEGWIVKKDTKYIVKVRNDSDAAIDVTIVIVFHRHVGES